MNNNTKWGIGKPTTFTVKHYDKTITIEIDHSDIDLNEVMETFESLTIAMGFSKDGFRDWVKEMALQYNEEDGWNEEKEKQFWAEQPPYPFATEVELEAMGERPPIDDEFDDYGMKKSK